MTSKNLNWKNSKTVYKLRPFLLQSACKEALWGGQKLKEHFGKQADLDNIAESWECSTHPEGPSTVTTGEHKGMLLTEVLQKYPEYLGTHPRSKGELPILVKFIDARQKLSVQVHPDDEYAKLYERGQLGKTEMWYVLEAEPGASLYYGFTHEISKEEFERRIQDNTLTDVLNAVPVHKGDCFFIPSGTLHAIRKGIVVAEIQQNSNVTYRIYDYGRLGADGKPRQLHIPQALDVTLREPPKAQDFHGHLAQCDYFTVDAVEGGFEDVCDETSFTSLLVLEGKGTLTETATGESLPIRKGESLFVPAGTGAYTVSGTDLKCLRTRV